MQEGNAKYLWMYFVPGSPLFYTNFLHEQTHVHIVVVWKLDTFPCL